MESHLKDRLLQDINRYPIFSKYFGPSLQQRIDTPHWFENRFIRASLRSTGWIEKHEKLLRDAGIEEVGNSYKIFSELDGNDPDYDLKIFDVLAEVRLVNWAKTNSYTSIEKLVPLGKPTPEFLMNQNGILTVAEAKHFRERDFLPEFIEDRLQGLVLCTGYLTQFGIFIHTTHKYDLERQDLLRKRLQTEQEYHRSIREELTKEWLKRLEYELAEKPETEVEIVNGFFEVSRSEVPSDVGVGWGPPMNSAELMLEKLGGNLMAALRQIKSFIESNPTGANPMKALVFLSGTDPFSIEWDDMWKSLCEHNDVKAWDKVNDIYEEAAQLIIIPFELIVGKGNPIRYVQFPWAHQK